MPKRRVEEEIEALGRLAETAEREAVAAAVGKALGDRVGLMVAKAAKIAGQRQLGETLPDLLRAFDRLFEKALERDPQCWGKNAIAQALVALGHRESAPYLRGARWVQLEPVWGGTEDTAPTLRGTCLLALPAADLRRDEALRWLVDGMTDPAQPVRLDAVRATAEMGGDEAVLLLRLKARSGDREPMVIGQVFEALLRLERAGAVGFVGSFLESGAAEVRSEAAMTLGTSRLPEAVETLAGAWESSRDAELHEILAPAISASRQPRAFEFLLDVVRNGRPAEAAIALDALSVHRGSAEIWRRVEEAAREAGSAMQERFRRLQSEA